jgi:hypothetical protein
MSSAGFAENAGTNEAWKIRLSLACPDTAEIEVWSATRRSFFSNRAALVQLSQATQLNPCAGMSVNTKSAYSVSRETLITPAQFAISAFFLSLFA